MCALVALHVCLLLKRLSVKGDGLLRFSTTAVVVVVVTLIHVLDRESVYSDTK